MKVSCTLKPMQHFLVFGNHPRLSLAEFKAIRQDIEKPMIIGSAAIVQDANWNGDILMQRLGGTVKLGDIVGTLAVDTCDADAIFALVDSRLRRPSADFGWTVFGGSKGFAYTLSRMAIPFKKVLKTNGISSRWVTAEHGGEISPAAVAKLKLTSDGVDICLFPEAGLVHVGLTTHVQDADSWSLRDYGRPARDDKNGMLPPKLARMMVNIANIPRNGTLVDPFCGSGTVCMEATLCTHASHIIGSDIVAKQIADSIRNQEWLVKNGIYREDDISRLKLFVSDVKKIGSHIANSSVDAVVTEGYLGPTLRGNEDVEILRKNVTLVKELWHETLKALHPALKKDGIVVCIWPGYKTTKGSAFVSLELDLENLGYVLVEPVGDWEKNHGPLVYSRPDQHITRRIVVLKKI